MCKYVNMRALVCVYVYISPAARFVSILFSYSFVVSLSLSLLFQIDLYCLINDDSIHIYRQTRVVLYCYIIKYIFILFYCINMMID